MTPLAVYSIVLLDTLSASTINRLVAMAIGGRHNTPKHAWSHFLSALFMFHNAYHKTTGDKRHNAAQYCCVTQCVQSAWKSSSVLEPFAATTATLSKHATSTMHRALKAPRQTPQTKMATLANSRLYKKAVYKWMYSREDNRLPPRFL